jgi:prolyl-tRNA synthetase
MTTGANEDDWHLRGVDVERDIDVTDWIDLRLVQAGEGCPECGEPLDVRRTIEIGHIFKLGTKFSEALGASVLDENGDERVIWMGSYGIGVGRNMAAVVEGSHDESGIVWPVSVAPYEVAVTVLKLDDETLGAANGVYDDLLSEGIDAIIDDRDERAGVKFADVELIGVPYRITVGPRGLAEGTVELVTRRDGSSDNVPVGEVAAQIAARIRSERENLA